MEIQILPRSVVVKLSKISISQPHVSSCAVGLYQLTRTVMSRQLFLDTVVQMEEVTLQAPLTCLSVQAYTHTLLVRLAAEVSNLSDLSEDLLRWPLSGSLMSKSISHL